MRARPTVTVIVPFAGSQAQLDELFRRLELLDLRPDDEVIVADNRAGAAADLVRGRIRVIRAVGVCSPGFARNRAAAVASGDWLVMLDADTEPSPALLDLYFVPPPPASTAILAGAIFDRPAPGPGVAALHSADRKQMSQETTLNRGRWSYAQSANIAVSRAAFVDVGGFDEEARAGEDADLCFRLAQAGHELESRPSAIVVHDTRATVPALLGQLARHGAGAAWLERRYPGSFPPPRARAFAARIGRHLLRAARPRRGGARRELLGAAEAVAFEGGRLLSNRPKRVRSGKDHGP